MEFKVFLSKMDEIYEFVNKAGEYSCDIIVKNTDRVFAIDGSSLMGMFSLDLSRPVLVQIEDIEQGEQFQNDVKKYIVE
ncbi:MAG: HPr family phosphocarrier protein [Lachnospiraceae bacterium]|nr:HPr family phosphocarrier protein [Lachnospiraceae bacterium]